MCTISSREAAGYAKERHDNFARKIRKLKAALGDETGEYFPDDTYMDTAGRERACYGLTRKGCEFLAGRMPVDKGRAFMEACAARLGNEPEEPEPVDTDLTVEEAAVKLGCTERTVYRMIKSGRLQGIQKEILVPTVKTYVTQEALAACMAERSAAQ